MLVFRIRAKHLWLGIGRLLNPRDGRYARRLWDSVVNLPLGLLGLDLRPRAQPKSSHSPLTKLGTRNRTLGESSPAAGGRSVSTDVPPTRTPRQIAADQRVLLQRIYDALAPFVTDVAFVGRKSKLTTINGAVFAEAIAKLADRDRVHPADLVAAAKSLHWTKERQDALAEALKARSPEQVLDPTEITALDLGPNVGSDTKKHLYQVASAQDVLDLFKDNDALVQAFNKSLEATDAAARSAALRSTVETWFNREMDQLSAMYRRQVRKMLAIVAFLQC